MKQKRQSFHLSPLQTSQQTKRLNGKTQWEHTKAIPAGTPCWWRVSLLDDTLFGKLTHLWLNLNPNHPWHLGPADLHITSILGTIYSTLGKCQHLCSTVRAGFWYERLIAFSFVTLLLSDRESMIAHQSVCSTVSSNDGTNSGIEISHIPIESIFPSFVNNISVHPCWLSKFIGILEKPAIAFWGCVTPSYSANQCLADFASTVAGRKTPMGMGMVRRLYIANH